MPVATRKAQPTEFPTLATVLARAFADDPVMAWFFPNETRRLARLERFFRVLDLGGPYGRADEVDTTEGLGAVAVVVGIKDFSVLRELGRSPSGRLPDDGGSGCSTSSACSPPSCGSRLPAGHRAA